MPKIDRDKTTEKFAMFSEADFSNKENNAFLTAILCDVLISINDSICELTEAVQASQPVSSAEPSHADSTQDPVSS